ncbi:MAG: helix-hairpin-helix domain-containing protein [Caldilinea sp.]|nr:hypothetical protein [Caldilinea sp.]MCB0147239.1 hypothetical protein [Caldilineaceae bacterium]MCB0038968.1 hypothetical protein [Caldilinea sp.]MCB9117516.1 hypothetical protein [Caldilineaceae bacterium]MCB9119953.1 hypothetical protein [Caldilineaceae bacterium]
MRKAVGLLFFGMVSSLAATLAVLYKQKSGALDAAQMRITSMERRMSTLAATPAPAGERTGEVDALRATVAAQVAELEELKRQLAEATASAAGFAQRSASTLEDAVADDLAAGHAALQERLSASSAELDDLRRRFHAETAWQAKAPALATAARGLEKLPAAKIDFANRAATARVVPAMLDEPQDLAEIPGIGTVFEQRLYNAGIGTFWEVAGLDDEQLRTILKFEKMQDMTVDLAGIRKAAAQLAAESGTDGYLWTGSGVDDFEPIKGIGKVYEQRLYDAGIRTYAALAAATPEQLAEMCQARSAVQPNYESWIAQARKLAGLES